MEDQSETIAFLSRPETYGISAAVERHETHTAFVFLAGDFAYKLKRAVKYSYLDYSTVGWRRAMCEAELAVNQRIAPDIYLRIQPVIRDDGHLAFGTTENGDAAIDWLVVMRRFSESDLLEKRLDAGDVSPAMLRELAESIAQFHGAAKKSVGYGGSAAIERTIAESRSLISTFEPQVFAAGSAQQFADAATE